MGLDTLGCTLPQEPTLLSLPNLYILRFTSVNLTSAAGSYLPQYQLLVSLAALSDSIGDNMLPYTESKTTED